jgi:hypothetical protein
MERRMMDDIEVDLRSLVATGAELDALAEQFGIPSRSDACKFEPKRCDPVTGAESDESIRARLRHFLLATPSRE